MINRSSWHCAAARAILFVCILSAGDQLLGQQAGKAAPPDAQTPSASPQNQPDAAQTHPEPANASGAVQSQPAPDPKVPQNDRILWTLPNYLTVENASSLPPLAARQKFKLVAQGTFDPLEFAFLGLEAGVDQASNTNPTFGQGFKGYGKRYALAFGDNTIENFMAGAVFPSVLRQDPRLYLGQRC